MLDLGRPLDAEPDDHVPLPTIPGLEGSDDSLRGVVITHGHPDHYGLVGAIAPSVPMFIGEAAARVLREASFFSPTGIALQPDGFLADRRPFSAGPFELTPHLVDHSAFDAYALRVAAAGRSLFYSGDLRAHGRKASLFERLIKHPPAVDALLLEGTRIDERDGVERGLPSERDVEEQALAVFRRASGAVLAFYSPQNLDRLVTLYRAAKRAGRLFVFDLYAAAIAAATGRETIPAGELGRYSRVRAAEPACPQPRSPAHLQASNSPPAQVGGQLRCRSGGEDRGRQNCDESRPKRADRLLIRPASGRQAGTGLSARTNH